MEGLVRTALSDKPLLKEKISKGGGYALLGADGLIWLLDDSYQTEHHGPQAAQNSWAKATQIEEGESFLIMGGRVVTAYSTGLQTKGPTWEFNPAYELVHTRAEHNDIGGPRD